jgi:hypothetical protein
MVCFPPPLLYITKNPHIHLSENASFNDWIGASFSASFDGGIRALDSLLIKPVQRLLKSPLFLGQLREFCAEGSEERAFCVKVNFESKNNASKFDECSGTETNANVGQLVE